MSSCVACNDPACSCPIPSITATACDAVGKVCQYNEASCVCNYTDAGRPAWQCIFHIS